MMSLCSRAPCVRALLGTALLCLFSGVATAGPIVNFVTGQSLSMQPNTSGSMTLQFTNSGDAPQGINSYTLAIMVIQTGGSGVLTFEAWAKPAAPLVVGDPVAEYTPTDPPGATSLNAPINVGGTDYFDYYPVQVAATDGFNYQLAPGETKNAGVLAFTSDAPGTWNVYLVNQEPQPGGLPVTFFQIADTTEFGFGNLPVGNGEFLQVGTITAVPEPSGLIAAGMAFTAIACSRYARRRS